MNFNFDYFTKEDLESFNFFRVPKALFTKEIFKSLNVEEKILYSAFLDRISLSQKNSWIDKEGKVYIIYTNLEIEEYFGFSKGSTVKYMKNLEKIGLIEKRVRGLGLPNLIYVKNFAKLIEEENEFKEKIESSEDNSKNLLENQNIDLRNAKDETEKFKNCTPEVQKVSTIYTDISNTDFNYTNKNNLSINQDLRYLDKSIDRLIDKLNNKIIFYDESYKKAYEKMLKIIKTTLQAKSDIVVSGIFVPFSKYFEKFKSLEKAHFEYALTCYFRNIDRIVNAKSYILSVLYSSLDKVGLTCEEKIPNLSSLDRSCVYDKVIDDFFRKKSFSVKKENHKKADKGNFFERLAMREKTSNFRYAFA